MVGTSVNTSVSIKRGSRTSVLGRFVWTMAVLLILDSGPFVSGWVASPGGFRLLSTRSGRACSDLPCLRSTTSAKYRQRVSVMMVEAEGKGEGETEPVIAPMGDWREFRAALINREVRLEEQNATTKMMKEIRYGDGNKSSASWAHEITEAEKGCILLSTEKFAFAQHYFSCAVITIVEHGAEGTLGFITNRPMTTTMGDVAPMLTAFKDCPLMFGGPVGSGVQVLHQVPGVRGSREVMQGLYYGADMEHASELVLAGKARPDQFRFFFQYSSWAPGQLEGELKQSTWYPAAASKDISLLPGKKALVQASNVVDDWLMVFGLMGGKFAAMAEQYRKQRKIKVGERLKEWKQAIQGGNVEDGAVILASMRPDWQGLGEDSASRSAVMDEFDRMSQRVQGLVSQKGSRFARGGGLAILEAMNHVLFEEMGFEGNSANYYDPLNSYIDKVLVHRKGNPITLSVIYMALARRLGLTLEGVNSPGHFMVHLREAQEDHYIDVFEKGRIMNEREAVESLRGRMGESSPPPPQVAWLALASPVQIWSRMGNNIIRAHLTQGDGDTSIGYSDALDVLEEAAQAVQRDKE